MSESLLEAIADRVLVGDGAMGTQLQRAGLEPGGCGDSWNLTHPERVLAIQRAYVEAGSDCLLTNTFGGCRISLERHAFGDQVAALNRAAVQIARDAFGDRPGFVIGDIGPFGGMLEPLGDVPPAQVQAAFLEQAEALVEAGADALIVETQTGLDELGIGLAMAKRVGAACVIGSMAFDVSADRTRLRTMMGVGPEDAARFMRDAGADIVGLNCGTGVDAIWAAQAIKQYREACDLPTMAQPNAGQPVMEKQGIVYKQTPDEMAAEMPGLLSAGPRIVGSCCGTSPDHVRRFRTLVDQWNASQKGSSQ